MRKMWHCFDNFIVLTFGSVCYGAFLDKRMQWNVLYTKIHPSISTAEMNKCSTIVKISFMLLLLLLLLLPLHPPMFVGRSVEIIMALSSVCLHLWACVHWIGAARLSWLSFHNALLCECVLLIERMNAKKVNIRTTNGKEKTNNNNNIHEEK